MLEARDITVTYPGGVTALDRVSLAVPRGTVLGLLGPNGAGKSTLLRVLATLQRPDSGSVSVMGIDSLAAAAQARAHLGFLPQEFGFPLALTPLELLDHFARLKGCDVASERRDVVAMLLDRLNLRRDGARPIRELSGGMKQRLGIAIALLGAPDVLIVDEPTVSLDPTERYRVHELIMELSDDRAVLFSSHLVAEVEALCHAIMVLHHGRVVRSGTTAALTTALQGRVFRARFTRPEAVSGRRMGRVVRESLVNGVIELTVIADQAPDTRFACVEPTLDDVYADATE